MPFCERPASVFKVHMYVLILVHPAGLSYFIWHLSSHFKCVVDRNVIELWSVDIIEGFVHKCL
jgi:hypothetical protein